jgi:signal transduction histidine kinase
MAAAVRIPSGWLYRIGVPAGWAVFTLIVMAVTWAGYAMQGRPAAPGTLFIQYLGLFLWGATTFVAVGCARRWPLGRGQTAVVLPLHIGLAMGVAAAQVALEYALGHALGARTLYLGLFSYKAYIYFLIYWLVVGAATAYDNQVRFQASRLLASQLEAQLAQSELHALKMQLHPHFLFNAHHAIVALMLQGESAAAVKMLTRLSDLLRLTLDKSRQQVTPLRDELAALDLYLGIQQERYRERLTIERLIEPGLDEAEVPYLLLQPLVENAFKHGIDALPAGGLLRVAAERVGETLRLRVWDNGPGIATALATTDANRVGLRNTKARLHGLYGERHRFEIIGGPGRGTEIMIELPFRVHADPLAATAVGT